ncbi:MAG TPA: dihydrolipoamide acetyltransferase family protein [Actinomycetota bacterium]|nr:dihydrolipoamide acetyltransferase family protein [Actinomycetota bacterium]
MSQTSAPATGSKRRVLATPLARAVAADRGVDLTTVTGTGRAGRILRADVEAAATTPAEPVATTPAEPVATTPAGAVDSREHPPSGSATLPLRGAEPGAGSVRAAPHFFLTIRVDAEALLGFRAELNRQLAAGGEDLKVSVNDLIVKACAALLRANPALNVSFAGDKLLRHRQVNVGIAVAIDAGLIVPVIHDADRKSQTQVAREARDLIGRARTGRLAAAEVSGGTFTVSNLGMYGVRQFMAVINPPEAAILAVGAAVPEPVVTPVGKVEVHQVLRLTLSIDHRALDGATGAAFLAQLKDLLEHPLRIVA